jgi:hypothetical protein
MQGMSTGSRMLSLLMFAMALTLGALPSRGADSDAVYQAKKRVNDADAQVRKAMAGVTIEANRIAKAVEITPAWQQAMLELKSAQARQLKASAAVKTALAADPNYKKAVAERTRTFEEKETLLQDPKATPEQRTNAAIATLKAAADISKLEQQALEDDPEVAKAKAAITEAQYTLDELRRGVLAKAASDPGILAAKQKVDAAKLQLADASKQLQEARKLQARADEQQLDEEIQRKQNAIVDPTRRR